MKIDIDQALREGILTEGQVIALKEMNQRKSISSSATDQDEKIGLIKGYNDIFITLAILLLAFGIYLVSPDDLNGIFIAVLGWISAEILNKKYRSILPMIVSTTLLAGMIEVLPIDLLTDFGDATDFTIIPYTLIPLAILVAAYWRFKLPFTLALIATNLVITTMILMLTIAWKVLGISLYDNQYLIQLFSFLSGIVVFIFAMRYDLSDPQRITRRADCAFWLHIIASALIIHGALGQTLSNVEDSSILLVGCVLLFILVVALLINRKSPIVASLIYAGSAIYFVTENAVSSDGDVSLAITTIILGIVMFATSIFWHQLRYFIMSFIEDTKLGEKLPPAHAPE
ncbi:hypothetical protein [Curvivirga sp.]|uniref:hypothetical protein n=1 Tax=Curvivirga sp. TaxID=2856848 RepID=UPI003B5B3EFB